MSSAARAAWVQDERRAQRRTRSLRPLSTSERKALVRMLREAREAGALLANGGRGGLPPSLVLGAFRRDGWRCKRCSAAGAAESGLLVHHKGALKYPESLWLQRKGKSNELNNLVTVCKRCHNAVHGNDVPPVEETPAPVAEVEGVDP